MKLYHQLEICFIPDPGVALEVIHKVIPVQIDNWGIQFCKISRKGIIERLLIISTHNKINRRLLVPEGYSYKIVLISSLKKGKIRLNERK